MTDTVAKLLALRREKDAANAAEFDDLVKRCAAGEECKPADVDKTLAKLGKTIEEFAEAVGLRKQRAAWRKIVEDNQDLPTRRSELRTAKLEEVKRYEAVREAEFKRHDETTKELDRQLAIIDAKERETNFARQELVRTAPQSLHDERRRIAKERQGAANFLGHYSRQGRPERLGDHVKSQIATTETQVKQFDQQQRELADRMVAAE